MAIDGQWTLENGQQSQERWSDGQSNANENYIHYITTTNMRLTHEHDNEPNKTEQNQTNTGLLTQGKQACNQPKQASKTM